jgi:hypothetical protein
MQGRGFSAEGGQISFLFFIWFAPMFRFPLEGARNRHFLRQKDAENRHEHIDIIELKKINGVVKKWR